MTTGDESSTPDGTKTNSKTRTARASDVAWEGTCGTHAYKLKKRANKLYTVQNRDRDSTESTVLGRRRAALTKGSCVSSRELRVTKDAHTWCK